MRRRAVAISLAAGILLAGVALSGSACSRNSAPPEEAVQITQEMMVSATPAFRNLGKRGESAL